MKLVSSILQAVWSSRYLDVLVLAASSNFQYFLPCFCFKTSFSSCISCSPLFTTNTVCCIQISSSSSNSMNADHNESLPMFTEMFYKISYQPEHFLTFHQLFCLRSISNNGAKRCVYVYGFIKQKEDRKSLLS